MTEYISNLYGALRNQEYALYARLHELMAQEFEIRERIQRVGREMGDEYARWHNDRDDA